MTEQEASAAPSPVLTLRESLKARPHVVTKSEDGWTIFEDDANRTIWSFVPDTNPAFPAVVKRQILSRGGRVSLNVEVLCEGVKEACDKLAADVSAAAANFEAGPTQAPSKP